jgi:hypothetical protein
MPDSRSWPKLLIIDELRYLLFEALNFGAGDCLDSPFPRRHMHRELHPMQRMAF